MSSFLDTELQYLPATNKASEYRIHFRRVHWDTDILQIKSLILKCTINYGFLTRAKYTS